MHCNVGRMYLIASLATFRDGLELETWTAGAGVHISIHSFLYVLVLLLLTGNAFIGLHCATFDTKKPSRMCDDIAHLSVCAPII